MPINVRPYAPIDDYDMIAGWWVAHRHPVIPDHLLPPIGFIAGMDGIDQVAVFIFFDRHVPVCFLGHMVSAPGLYAWEVADAGGEAIEHAKDFARSYGSQIMRVYAPKGLVRFSRHNGFEVAERDLLNIECALQEEEICHRQFQQ